MLIYPDLHKYTILAGIIFKFHFLHSPLKSWVHPAHMQIFLETLSMETGHSFFLVCTNPPISSIINPNHLCSHGILSWNSFPRSLPRPQHRKNQSSCTEPILIYISPSSHLSCTGWHVANGIKLTLKIAFDHWKGCAASKAGLTCYPWKWGGIKALSAPGRVKILLKESENLTEDTELAADPQGRGCFMS